MAMRNSVFISYAHEDSEWKDEFTAMFQPAVARGSISLWSDEQIPVGEDWTNQIDRALNDACAGLVLVTPHFLKSKFITDVELKRLLNLAKTARVAIHWVPIAPTLYTQTALAAIEASWDPSRPLEQLSHPDRHQAIQQICLRIVDDFGFLPKVATGHRERLRDDVQLRLGERYDVVEEIGSGKLSIFYRAQQRQPNRTVGVKVFVGCEFDDWARSRFQEAVVREAQLTSPAFIKIIESSMSEQPELLVTEFVRGEPLSRYLPRYPNGAPLAAVKHILLDLATAIEELHQAGCVRGEICASDVLIEYERTVAARLSAVDFSTLLSEESQMAGNFLIDRESLAYMTPERFFGHPHTARTDQYSLGLLATELLGGERVPRVFSPSDLERKRAVFAAFEAADGRWAERSRDFAGVVSRMLRTDPAQRWPCLRDVRSFLNEIDVAQSEDEVSRSLARKSYLRMQLGDSNALFARFYRNLFTSCPELEPRFAGIDMDRQYKMLNDAILLLLDFDPARGSKPLRDLATRHTFIGLTKHHYDQFLEALLDAVAQSSASDAGQLSAWRKILSPAMDFMWTCQGNSASTVRV